MVLGLAVLLLCSVQFVDVASQVLRSYLELRKSLDVRKALLGATVELAPMVLSTSVFASTSQTQKVMPATKSMLQKKFLLKCCLLFCKAFV